MYIVTITKRSINNPYIIKQRIDTIAYNCLSLTAYLH